MYSQNSNPNSIVINGNVIDSLTQQPIEFATISFNNNVDLKGVTTDKNGKFKIKIAAGIYNINVQFLSYAPRQFINKELKSDTNLGVILLSLHTENLEEVNLVAETNLIEFKIDKKIYNASKDIANKGGTGMDVLNNTPAVRIDQEGNVILRGSNASVLIDGKPLFGLESSTDILRSIPSSTIEKVEIITHSAKYSAEGGGIINIITRKRKGSGLNGSLDINLGSPENNGFSTFLNENTEIINIFSTISFNNEKRILSTNIDQIYFDNSDKVTGFFEEIRKDENQRNSFLFNIGSDFYIDNYNTITSSFLVNTNNKNYISNLSLDDFDDTNSLLRSAQRNVGDFDDISKIELFLNYTSKFNDDGHQLSFDFKFDNTISENEANILESTISPVSELINQKVDKNQNLDNFLFQLDYTLPLNETKKIELGYKGTFRYYENDYKVSQFDETLSDFVTIGGFDDILNYDEKINAIYGQFNAMHGNFFYSLGLRTEMSEITIAGSSNNIINKNYTDLFPSASLGYEFEDGAVLTADYSRSINRPEIAQLNPFISLNDERFQTVGNPNLNPYYQDYLAISYDFSFEKLTLISSFYMNNSKDQFLTVLQNTGQNIDGLDMFTRTTINSGDKNILAVDVDASYSPVKGLRLGAYLSPYNLDITNTINNQYDFNSWMLYAEASALVTLNNGLRFQANYYYQSPKTDGLTKLKKINFANLTVSKDLFNKNAYLTFKIKDVFNSFWYTMQSYEANTNTVRSRRYDQQFSLSFTYRFNQKRRSAKDRSDDINKDELEDKQDEKL